MWLSKRVKCSAAVAGRPALQIRRWLIPASSSGKQQAWRDLDQQLTNFFPPLSTICSLNQRARPRSDRSRTCRPTTHAAPDSCRPASAAVTTTTNSTRLAATHRRHADAVCTPALICIAIRWSTDAARNLSSRPACSATNPREWPLRSKSRSVLCSTAWQYIDIYWRQLLLSSGTSLYWP